MRSKLRLSVGMSHRNSHDENGTRLQTSRRLQITFCAAGARSCESIKGGPTGVADGGNVA